jgi:hypothetical protein
MEGVRGEVAMNVGRGIRVGVFEVGSSGAIWSVDSLDLPSVAGKLEGQQYTGVGPCTCVLQEHNTTTGGDQPEKEVEEGARWEIVWKHGNRVVPFSPPFFSWISLLRCWLLCCHPGDKSKQATPDPPPAQQHTSGSLCIPFHPGRLSLSSREGTGKPIISA